VLQRFEVSSKPGFVLVVATPLDACPTSHARPWAVPGKHANQWPGTPSIREQPPAVALTATVKCLLFLLLTRRQGRRGGRSLIDNCYAHPTSPYSSRDSGTPSVDNKQYLQRRVSRTCRGFASLRQISAKIAVAEHDVGCGQLCES
jgi:hypothetical protein